MRIPRWPIAVLVIMIVLITGIAIVLIGSLPDGPQDVQPPENVPD